MINESIHELFDLPFKSWLKQMPKSVQAFFDTHQFETKLDAIKSNCKTLDQFRKQFYIWFDGFMCMKFVHFARDNFYDNISLFNAANTLLNVDRSSLTELLDAFRTVDLESWVPKNDILSRSF